MLAPHFFPRQARINSSPDSRAIRTDQPHQGQCSGIGEEKYKYAERDRYNSVENKDTYPRITLCRRIAVTTTAGLYSMSTMSTIWSEDIKVDGRPLCGRTHKEARKEACKYKEAHRGEN